MRSSEFLRFMRPIESGWRCSVALSKSLRFRARTMASRSSCVPAPTCEPAPAGPHCFGGGALVDVRRACVGVRLRVAAELLGAVSLPRTLAARPWTADQEFPKSPERVDDVSRVALEAWMPADLKKADGAEVTLAGDAVLEVIREPALELNPSLSSVA